MTCEACEHAKTHWPTGVYVAACNGCKARMLAGGVDMFYSRLWGYRTPEYASALDKMFGKDGAEEGHRSVWRWVSIMEKLKQEAA